MLADVVVEMAAAPAGSSFTKGGSRPNRAPRTKPADAPPAAYVDPVPLDGPTSTVVRVDPKTGGFAWEDAVLLLPHEGLRVAMLRIDRVMPFLARDLDLPDGASHWRFGRLSEYVRHVFTPFVIEHHDIEEHVISPHYAALGDERFSGGTMGVGLASDHSFLLASLADFSAELTLLVKEDGSIGRARLAAFVGMWGELRARMCEHLAREESEWPKVFMRHGRANFKKVLPKIERALLRGTPLGPPPPTRGGSGATHGGRQSSDGNPHLPRSRRRRHRSYGHPRRGLDRRRRLGHRRPDGHVPREPRRHPEAQRRENPRA